MEYTDIEYPQHVYSIKEIAALSGAIDIEMAKLGVEADNLDYDTTIAESTENGIKRREAVLGIIPLDSSSLEDRRNVVSVRWSDRALYTERYLKRQINTMIGSDDWSMEVDYKNAAMNVRVSLESKATFNAIKELIEEVVPMHIKLDIDLLYNTWSNMMNITWDDSDEESWSHWKSDVL